MDFKMPPQQGWVCPKCEKVLAPWVDSCSCANQGTIYSDRTDSPYGLPYYNTATPLPRSPIFITCETLQSLMDSSKKLKNKYSIPIADL